MAVIQDPQGAYFMLWQPRDHRRRGAGERAWRARVERAAVAGPGRVGSRSTASCSAGSGAVPGHGRTLPVDQERRGANNGGIARADAAGAAELAGVLRRRGHRAWRSRRCSSSAARTLAGPIDIGMAKIAVVGGSAGRSVRAVRGRARALEPRVGVARGCGAGASCAQLDARGGEVDERRRIVAACAAGAAPAATAGARRRRARRRSSGT